MLLWQENTDHEKSEKAEESADHTQTRQRDTKTEDNEETTQEEDSPPKVDDDFLEDVDEAADKNPTAEVGCNGLPAIMIT